MNAQQTRRLAARIARLKTLALQIPWDGRAPTIPRQRIVHPAITDRDLTLSILLTFDIGMHASGWWRNSDYDRCWHLSLVCRSADGYEQLPQPEWRWWASFVFGDDVRLAWVEPPASKLDIYRTAPTSPYTVHVRVFVDRHGQPIMPAGEVYHLKPWTDGLGPPSPEKVFRS